MNQPVLKALQDDSTAVCLSLDGERHSGCLGDIVALLLIYPYAGSPETVDELVASVRSLGHKVEIEEV